MSMAENEGKKPKIAIVGGGRGAGRTMKTQLELLEELEAYRAIGTIEELKALKEKNEPKRLLTKWEMYPTNHGVYSSADRWCPSCKSLVFDGDWSISKQKMMYNRHRCGCGQILDWR